MIEVLVFVLLFLILIGVLSVILNYLHQRITNLYIKINELSGRVKILESSDSLKKEIDTFKDERNRKKKRIDTV